MSRVRVFWGVVMFVGIILLGGGCKPGYPVAGFTVEPTSGVAPLKVRFTDRSAITKESTINGWLWTFGDGDTSAEQNPEHTYAVAGSYNVSLTVASSDGMTHNATIVDCVKVLPDTGPEGEGEPPVLVSVPHVAGMARVAAEAALISAGLVVGTVTEQYHVTVPIGSVIIQDPAAGAKVLRGSAVSFVVSKGLFVIETATVLLPGDVPLELVRIPAGSFQMGSPDTERGRFSNEGPVHTVTIGYDFYMGKYEVTQGQWLAVMGSWPGSAPYPFGAGSNYPAYNLSWDDVQAFIMAVNSHMTSTGQGPATLRLPSEAEWEYACRAGTQMRFYFGDSLEVADDCEDDGLRSQYMWYCGNRADYGEPGYFTNPVGVLLPNGFGLHDMSGSLWEWCEDWWHSNYTGAPADGSAWILNPSASARVARGGDMASAWECRSASRGSGPPFYRGPDVGFRLASVR